VNWKGQFPKENRFFETDNGILYCGDCLKVMREFPNKSVDLLLTDPPYNISQKNNFSTMKRYHKYQGIDFGEWDKGFDITGWIPYAFPLLRQSANIVIFTSWLSLGKVAEEITRLGGQPKRPIVLYKQNPVPANRDRLFVNAFEFAIWAVVGKGWVFNRQRKYEVPMFPVTIGRGVSHPTQKPLAAIEWLVTVLSESKSLVLDPFLGSGTTAIACEKLGRRWVGIEIEEKYCEIAKKRLLGVCKCLIQ